MKKYIAILVLLFSTQAFAFMIEPYLGYEMGSIKQDTATDKMKTSGLGYGLRLGTEFAGMFWAALDGGMATGKAKDDSSEVDITRTNAALVFGVDLPILFRFWAGYGFMSDVKLKSSTDEATLKGKYTKIGMGYTGLPFVSINLEYVMHEYSKYKSSSGDFDVTYPASDNSALVLGLSVPL